MFDTLEACAAAWEQAGNHGDIQTRIARNARWIPYYAFLADGREEADAAIDPHAAAVADGLVSRGYLGAGSTVLDIGSGTGAFAHAFASRSASVTASAMARLLQSAWASPVMPDLLASLPVAGQDGTLKKRFQTIGSPLRLKTGTLKNVRALAGYWLPETPQHPLAIVVLVNSEQSGAYLPDLDRLVMQLLPAFAPQ